MFPTEIDEQAMARGNYVIDDLLADHSEDNEVIKGAKKAKRKIEEGKNDAGCNESKKSVFRDTEKRRRREMAALYASLRSLLPLEYVKGKRAVCDQMEQAVNYIKDMQNKIQETKMRINKLVHPNFINYECVKVNLLSDNGMEILITTHVEECSFPLSKVLAYLLELGFNVTTSLSTGAHTSTFHKLHIELDEITSIDISELKQRLVNLIKVA